MRSTVDPQLLTTTRPYLILILRYTKPAARHLHDCG
jgi:hypothetical protein